ncbi:MAG TPA: DUF1800 domain-containing protein [Burkholderiaceae bacterium]|nr:DUF1800 domain-containing protein [Burkholderiaceae bacterium]
MTDRLTRPVAILLACVTFAGLVSGCSSANPSLTARPTPGPAVRPDPKPAPPLAALDQYALLDRISWGATASSLRAIRSEGSQRWIQEQLHPLPDPLLPQAVAQQIAALSIQSAPMPQRVIALELQRRDADKLPDEEARKTARKTYQDEMNTIGRETATRMLLRALYSPNQLQEQMTWFWFNHFNVFQYKNDERLLLADYEQTLRAHALGRFRDLVGAVARHPAMLVYLDNAQNAINHVNENFARELMELHTLGVDAGYTQRDVQELARVLTGFGVNRNDPATNPPPKFARPERAAQYIRQGLYEFNPHRHDYEDKQVLGVTIKGRGPQELDQVIDLLSRHPATARHISRKLAQYFVSDDPPQALVDRMAERFQRTDGDIAAVLQTMFESPEFAASLRARYKDPMHYVVSAVRLAYDEKPVLNAGPMINWLNRLGEGPYNRQTPDGFPLTEPAWTGPGQLTTRFEIAKAIGSGSAGLFKTEGPTPTERPAFPQLSNALYFEAIQNKLAQTTRQALDQAASPQEWNMLLLSAPEFMVR